MGAEDIITTCSNEQNEYSDLGSELMNLIREIEGLDIRIPDEMSTTLEEMEAFQEENPRMRNVPRKSGEILYYLVTKFKCKSILEVGTSNGFSTLWLALAAKETGGKVSSFEKQEWKSELAARNLAKARLSEYVDLISEEVTGETGEENGLDLIFLDVLPAEYLTIVKSLLPRLQKRAIIVADNLLSHRDRSGAVVDASEEGRDYLEFVNANKNMASTILNVGSGLQIVLYDREFLGGINAASNSSKIE